MLSPGTTAIISLRFGLFRNVAEDRLNPLRIKGLAVFFTFRLFKWLHLSRDSLFLKGIPKGIYGNNRTVLEGVLRRAAVAPVNLQKTSKVSSFNPTKSTAIRFNLARCFTLLPCS